MTGTALVKNKVGRPPFNWTDEVMDTLIEGLICGMTLKEICDLPGMPSYVTVWYKRQDDPEFSKRLLRAREEGAHYLADECVVIANTQEIAQTRTYKPEGGVEVKMEDAIAHRRLKIDTRLRLIGKWNAMYGDRKALEVSAPGGGPVQHIHTEMTPREAAEAYADMLRSED